MIDNRGNYYSDMKGYIVRDFTHDFVRDDLVDWIITKEIYIDRPKTIEDFLSTKKLQPLAVTLMSEFGKRSDSGFIYIHTSVNDLRHRPNEDCLLLVLKEKTGNTTLAEFFLKSTGYKIECEDESEMDKQSLILIAIPSSRHPYGLTIPSFMFGDAADCMVSISLVNQRS